MAPRRSYEVKMRGNEEENKKKRSGGIWLVRWRCSPSRQRLKISLEKGPIAGWLGSSRLVSLCTCTRCATREVEPRNPSLNAFPAASRERIGDDLTPSRERVKSRRFKPRGVDALLKRRFSDSEGRAKNEILERNTTRLLYTVYNAV